MGWFRGQVEVSPLRVLKASLKSFEELLEAPACRDTLPTPCSPLRHAMPTLLFSAVWEDTYESFTLLYELAHQTPGDPDGHSPIIAPAPWADRRHHEHSEGPGSWVGG